MSLEERATKRGLPPRFQSTTNQAIRLEKDQSESENPDRRASTIVERRRNARFYSSKTHICRQPLRHTHSPIQEPPSQGRSTNRLNLPSRTKTPNPPHRRTIPLAMTKTLAHTYASTHSTPRRQTGHPKPPSPDPNPPPPPPSATFLRARAKERRHTVPMPRSWALHEH